MIAQEQQGPFSEGQVRQMYKAASITSETLYWKEGMPEWRPVVDLLPPVAKPAIQAAQVPERRAGASSAARRSPLPQSAREPSRLWLRLKEFVARFSPEKNPAAAKGWVIIIGLILALVTMYVLVTTGFLASHLAAPDPTPGPFDEQ
jgi:hypothetical protein